jgi:large subunit ribosomal protein L5
MGVPDQSVFAEIDLADLTHSLGMNITFVTSARRDSDALELLKRFGMPFRRTEEQAA